MVVEIKIDSNTGDVATRAFISSSEEHAAATQMLERIGPSLEALQGIVVCDSAREQM